MATQQCKQLFQGTPMTIVHNNTEPFLYTKTKPYYGQDYEMILYLAEAIGFIPRCANLSTIKCMCTTVVMYLFSFIANEDGTWGRRMPDGNFTGMIGTVQRGVCNISYCDSH